MCARPASKLVNNVIGYLSQAEPEVKDFPQPVCYAEACEVEARQQWQEVLLQLGREEQMEINQMYTCCRCGKNQLPIEVFEVLCDFVLQLRVSKG